MAAVLVFGKNVLKLICGYAPQCVRSWKEKQSLLYNELKGELELDIMCMDDLTGHSCRCIGGCDRINERCCVSQKNFEGRI